MEPGPDEARDWLLDELSRPEYQAEKPNWFDQLAYQFFQWLDSLFQPTGTPLDALAPLVATIVAAGVIVGAFVLFGRPRWTRSQRRTGGVIFGAAEMRSASELLAAARRAAAADDWTHAVPDLFRALVRRLDERGVVTASPALTSHEFSLRASGPFPELSAELAAAADHFDAVRYLRQPATAAMYMQLDALTRELWNARIEVTSS